MLMLVIIAANGKIKIMPDITYDIYRTRDPLPGEKPRYVKIKRMTMKEIKETYSHNQIVNATRLKMGYVLPPEVNNNA